MTARDAGYFNRQMRAHLMDDLNDAKAERDRERGIADTLGRTLEAVGVHIEELREAWERGIISEHDGRGGTRSNRNFDMGIAIATALRQWREAREGGTE